MDLKQCLLDTLGYFGAKFHCDSMYARYLLNSQILQRLYERVSFIKQH